jgi:hypothetical protein
LAEPEALSAAKAAAVIVTEAFQLVVKGRLPTLSKEIILVGGVAVRESMTTTRGASLRQSVLAAKVRRGNAGGDGTGGMIAALSILHNHVVAAVYLPRK